MRCPNCGSTNVVVTRRDFDPGWGCLGALLFGWVGLLLGLLFGGDVELCCGDCGRRRRIDRSDGCGCAGLIVLGLLLLVLARGCGVV